MNKNIVEIDGVILNTIGDIAHFIRLNYGGSIKNKKDLLESIKDRAPIGLSIALLEDIIKMSFSKNRLSKINDILDELN